MIQSSNHSFFSQKHEQMIDWKYMRTYDILVAEIQFFGIENSVWIATHCKDIALIIRPYFTWLILWFAQ